MRLHFLLLCLPLILCLFPSSVVGHAKLNSPTAWNPNPSKTQICGVGNNNNPALYRVTQITGQTLTVTWQVTIGDGVGPLTATVDPTAKANPTARDFSTTLTATTANNPNRVGTFTVSFALGNLVCSGPGGTCTLKIQSSSGWVACATIKAGQPATTAPTAAPTNPPTTRIPTTAVPTTHAPTTAPTDAADEPTPSDEPTDTPQDTEAPTSAPTGAPTDAPIDGDLTPVDEATTTPPTDKPDTDTPSDEPTDTPTDAPTSESINPQPSASNPCVVAVGLVTCSSINGQSVQLMGPSLSVIDNNVKDTIQLAMNNPAVLTTPKTTGCSQAFTDLICAQNFPVCLTSTPSICTTSCKRVNSLCKPNATLYDDGTSHSDLYDCSDITLGYTATMSDVTGNCPDVNTGVRPASQATQQPKTTPKPTSNPRQFSHAMIVNAPIMMISLVMGVVMFVIRL